MNTSLSLIYPVCNAQEWLADKVALLLEFVPDLASKFELVIIDNGSSDSTMTIASDFARVYPQVRAVRNEMPYSINALTQVGIENSTGEIIMIQESPEPSWSELSELWKMRNDHRLVMVHAPENEQSSDDTFRQGATRMLRRRAVVRLANCQEPQEYLNVESLKLREDQTHTQLSSRPKFLVRMKSALPKEV